jgi:hypothetical protein
MAVKADLRLRRRRQDRVTCYVARVAVGAGQVIEIVFVAVPAKSRVGLVTVHAHTVLHADGRGSIGTKNRAWGRTFLAAPYAPCVIAGRAMAGFTLQLAVAEWTVRVRRIGMCATEKRERGVVLMTGQTGVRTLATVGFFLANSGAAGQERQHRCCDDECEKPHIGNLCFNQLN